VGDAGFAARAEQIAGTLRAASDRIESARSLPPDVVGALVREGFTRLCVPRSLGGPELHPAELVATLETLAEADGSAGWCAMIASTSSVLAAYLPPDAAKLVYGEARAVSGGVFAPRGVAVRTAGGFRVSGRWAFASGCTHCTWLMGGCFVEGPAGRETIGGAIPDIRLLLFPREEAKILDTWDVAGLAGTGSHDIEVRDLFVPEGRDVSLLGDRPREVGALYAIPPFALLSVGVAAVGLGIARRAIGELAALARAKTPVFGQRRLAERPVTQSRVAEATAELAGARAGVLAAVDRAWRTATAGETLGTSERATLRAASTHAVRAAARIAAAMFDLGGGGAVYRTSPLQRCLRDAHVVKQHAMVGEGTFELAGRVLLGIDGDTSLL
jgi:alkylation response protein AidB-like acyl-CoA dehydrogenase